MACGRGMQIWHEWEERADPGDVVLLVGNVVATDGRKTEQICTTSASLF